MTLYFSTQEIHITQFFNIGKVHYTRWRSLANLKSLKIVSYELFFHDSLSSISVRLGSCNKTLDYLLL